MPLPFIGALAGAFGVSTSTVGGGLLSGIASGLSSLFGGKSKKKQAEQEFKNNLALAKETAKVQGEEERKTSRYNVELESAVDEYQRARKRGAFKNFGFATPTDPYANTAMQGYQQAWKPEDTKLVLPGAPGASGSSAITNAEPGSPYAPPVRPPNSLAAPVRR